jgi:hypothetical protein
MSTPPTPSARLRICRAGDAPIRRGEDLRHALAQTGGVIDETQCSPVSGLPWGCCRIRSTVISL